MDSSSQAILEGVFSQLRLVGNELIALSDEITKPLAELLEKKTNISENYLKVLDGLYALRAWSLMLEISSETAIPEFANALMEFSGLDNAERAAMIEGILKRKADVQLEIVEKLEKARSDAFKKVGNLS